MTTTRARVSARKIPPFLNGDGTLRQPERIAAAQWRDPDDTQAMERDERGRAHRKTISGFRAIDPLTRLPCAPEHFRAATKLRTDWERGSGARSGGAMEKVDGSKRDHDSIAAGLEARRRYQGAVEALGQRASAYVLPVVLSGWTVADLVGRNGGNAMSVQGRVMAGLDRLVDHYSGGKQEAFVVPLSTLVVDTRVVDLPQERLGRYKRFPPSP